MRLHWQAGDEAFAERALQIAEDAIAKTSDSSGVTETEPIDFFVYADAEDFQSALGPGTKEFVAGRAIAEIRTLFARIAARRTSAPTGSPSSSRTSWRTWSSTPPRTTRTTSRRTG